MDLTRPVIYRGYYLNDPETGPMAGGIHGCVLDSADISDVDVVQFIEKRSQQDGMDAGEVFLGARRVRLAGTLYEVSRPALYDEYWKLRACLSPTNAQLESPADHGFRPIYFSTPSLNPLYSGDGGLINLQMLALPRQFQAIIQRDLQGGSDADSLAMPWQATLICRDPSIMAASPIDTTLAGGQRVLNGALVNRGTYPAPLNAIFKVTLGAISITMNIGGSVFTIAVPSSSGDRIIRLKGEDKMLTVEENGVELPRMDLITFANSTTWPVMPPGSSNYTFSATTTGMYGTSHFWYYERYA